MKYSSAANKLIPKLRKLWDNDDYVEGIITFAKTDKNIIKISQFIDMSYRMDKKITADDCGVFILRRFNMSKLQTTGPPMMRNG